MASNKNKSYWLKLIPYLGVPIASVVAVRTVVRVKVELGILTVVGCDCYGAGNEEH